jgi:regulator of replication initiation timing
MAKTAVAQPVGLEPIDRLEEKIKLLVDTVTQLRAEQARALDENARLTQELDTLRSRLADAETAHAELATLRDEREAIRTRVADMLTQLEAV